MPDLNHNLAETATSAAEFVTDEVIVDRVLGGDLAAFEVLMRRYNQRLFRVLRGLLGDDDEAEDVLQDAYLRAFEHLAQFAGRSRFSTWLTKIGVHEALARRRRRRRLQVVNFDDPEILAMNPVHREPGPEQQAANHELRHLLTEAVDSLPDELREVFALRMIDDLDTRKTADCLQLTEANVKVRLHRARAVLRARLDAQIGAEVRKLYEFGGSRCDRVVRTVLARLVDRQATASESESP